MSDKPKKARIHILDTVRGVAIIYMVAFHTLFDLAVMFGAEWAKPIYAAQAAHYSIFDTGAFVLLAGMTVRFSRNPALHGARLLAIASCFTIVTSFFFEGSAIYFGALHLISVGMLCYAVGQRVIEKIPWWAGAAICVLLFALTFNSSRGWWGFGERLSIPVPSAFTYNNYMYPFGTLRNLFSTADYLPMLPWLFMFLCGSFLGRFTDSEKLPRFCTRDYCPPVTFVGKYSLMIYIVHQPIIYAILFIIFKLIR